MLTFPINIPCFFCYPEIHYKFFRFFPSIIYKKQPEVIFDIPARCTPNKDIPVILIVNDLHKFNFNVLDINIVVNQIKKEPVSFFFSNPEQYKISHPLKMYSDVYILFLPRNKLPEGKVYINCKATLQYRNKKIIVVNDNIFSSSKMPFCCFLTNISLPQASLCSYGDLHIHSQFSQSPVEFGPPIEVIDLIAEAYGIDFVAITDHSYDLACMVDNYLKVSNKSQRWELMLNEISKVNKKSKIITICGEEISVFNSKNKVVHLCGIGMKEYIEGSADGARFNSLRTYKIKEAAEKIHLQNGLAIAAHPGSKCGFMQRLFLKRGIWKNNDLVDIDAIQAVNNGFSLSWERAKKMWTRELLNNKKIPLVAGNDSHGDFNRYRYIYVPFIYVAENFLRHLAYARTGIYSKAKSEKDVLECIKKGKTFITTGPFLCLSSSSLCQDAIISNNDIKIYNRQIELSAIITSSYEYGYIEKIVIYFGNYSTKKEIIVFAKYYYKERIFEKVEKINIKNLESGYLRAEVSCLTDDGIRTFGATSACYLTT